MKKTLLLSALFLGSIASISAKELSFTVAGNPVENGSTVVYTDCDIWDDIPGEVDYIFDPKVFLTSDEAAVVTVKTTADHPIQLCAGSDCITNEVVVKDAVNLQAGVPLDLLLEYALYFYNGEEEYVPDVEVLVESWYNDDPSTVYSFTLKMGFTAGVNEIKTKKNFVSVTGNSLQYNIDNPANLSVFSLTGRTLITRKVTGNGSIDLHTLTPGVYVYKISGKNNSTGKFVIR